MENTTLPFAGLAADNISKSFAENLVLKSVTLNFAPGQVHALIGENGAGKSTLMKILGGYQLPSSGQLLLDGRPAAFASPKQAEAQGIVLVHQEIHLAPHLTVAQNIFLGRELRKGIWADDKRMNEASSQLLSNLNLTIDPRVVVESLPIAKRQMVQIARALSGPHKTVIFDEPTASLTPHESEALFAVIDSLRQKNKAIIFISHKLDEVKRLSDVVSVLRDGKLVAHQPAQTLQPVDMAHLMVGRELGQLYPPKLPADDGESVLQVHSLSVPGFVRGVSFNLKSGEVLGFAGLIGAGRSESFEGLMGLRAATGDIVVRDQKSGPFSGPKAAAKSGLAYVTEDRKGKGLLLESPLANNLTLSTLGKFTRGGLIDRRAENLALDQAITDFDIRAKSKMIDAGRLSGGNQQKLLLAKTLLANPSVIIIDEPTRGVDIGAKQQIYELIVKLAKAGKSIVIISSEMQELIGLCHRVLVMRQGRIAGEVAGKEINERNIVTLATGTA
ncbi:MAG: sugar ABC transporter ATP-binding protein [Alphaproteobacteria bacterium]|nr:sugar ABC transporter ATP-binding protein [Alphaproteobacteria bacterium]